MVATVRFGRSLSYSLDHADVTPYRLRVGHVKKVGFRAKEEIGTIVSLVNAAN